MLAPDRNERNADWPKRTPDTMRDIARRVQDEEDFDARELERERAALAPPPDEDEQA